MIWTMLNDKYSVELFAQRWIICTALNYLYSVEWFVNVEWFVQRWMIFYDVEWFFTTLKNLYDVKWLVQSWKICTTLNDSECDGWFVQRWIDELLIISFLMCIRCAYSRKYCKIFYTNLWVLFFLNWEYQKEMYLVMPHKLVIKRCFWSL